MISKKSGSERLQKKVLIYKTLEKEPGMHAYELIEKMQEYGVALTRSSAYRAIASFKKNDSITDSEVRCVRVVSKIMETVPEGELVTARDILDRAFALGESLHRSTVYRVLDRLKGSALVRATQRGRQTCYEWQRSQQHGFLTCVQCSRTIEFKQEGLDERAKSLCEDSGYEFQRVELLLRSICTGCWAEKEAGNVD